MKHSFSDEPSLSEELFDFLEIVFPGLRKAAQQARALGATWESVSTPFVSRENGRIVSHVGLLELPMVLLGKIVPVGAIHAVATHPDHRRRGHYRQLMEEVLEVYGDRYETLILITGNPEYYRPFGFRILQEHCFRVPCDSSGNDDDLRLIDKCDVRDVALVNRLLETREAVSNVVGVVNEKAVFCFNEGQRPLRYAEDLDIIICMEVDGPNLKLFDVVGPKVPSLAAILERIPRGIEEVTLHFAADRIFAEAKATPYVLEDDGPSYLMARGPFPAEQRAFTLPRSSRP